MKRAVPVYLSFVVVALVCCTASASEIDTVSVRNRGDFYVGGIFRSPLEFDFADKMGGISFDYMTPSRTFKFMAGCDAWIGRGALGGMLRIGGVLSVQATRADISLILGIAAGVGREMLDYAANAGGVYYPFSGVGMVGIEFGITDDIRIRVVMDVGYGYFYNTEGDDVGSMIVKGGLGVVL